MGIKESSGGWITASNAFKIAAVINAISIYGHTAYGYTYVYNVLDTIDVTPDNLIGRYGPEYAWNYVNSNFAVMALMNWQWGQKGAPSTIIEQLIFWINFLICMWGGSRYFAISSYQPLIPLWYANAFSITGILLS